MTELVSPQGALLQVNRFCNLKCSHCSLSAPFISRKANRSELSFDEWKAILERLQKTGIQRVRFTGGEPFLRDDLEQICRAAQERGLEISFVTNGLAILPNHLPWITELRPKILWISVYGFPEPVYDEISGKRGGFRRLENTLRAVLTANLEIGLYYPLGDRSFGGVGGFLMHAYGMGIRNVKILQVLPHGRAIDGKGLGQLKSEELECALDDIVLSAEACAKMRVRVSMQSGQSALFESKGFVVPSLRSCQIGLQNLWTLDSCGIVTACCLFLNTDRLDLLVATQPEEFSSWRHWGRAQVLRRLGVNDSDVMSTCPALPDQDASNARGDFVCPLTYAECRTAHD